MPRSETIVIGKITTAHGIQGEVKVSLFVDDGEFIRDLDFLYLEGRPRREIKLKRARITANQAILAFEGLETRNDAEALRGRELSIPVEWLPELDEGEYYVAEIVGLAVETEEGEPLGTLEEVIFTGANEVYVIRGGPKGEILLPAIESVVQSVDLEAGRMVVTLPEGLVE